MGAAGSPPTSWSGPPRPTARRRSTSSPDAGRRRRRRRIREAGLARPAQERDAGDQGRHRRDEEPGRRERRCPRRASGTRRRRRRAPRTSPAPSRARRAHPRWPGSRRRAAGISRAIRAHADPERIEVGGDPPQLRGDLGRVLGERGEGLVAEDLEAPEGRGQATERVREAATHVRRLGRDGRGLLGAAGGVVGERGDLVQGGRAVLERGHDSVALAIDALHGRLEARAHGQSWRPR